jgi:hypothetical protein
MHVPAADGTIWPAFCPAPVRSQHELPVAHLALESLFTRTCPPVPVHGAGIAARARDIRLWIGLFQSELSFTPIFDTLLSIPNVRKSLGNHEFFIQVRRVTFEILWGFSEGSPIGGLVTPAGAQRPSALPF